MFAKGTKVTQVLPAPISGDVDGFELDQQSGEVLLRVVWSDQEGTQHSRYFKESELQESVG